jgi:hypothetical protein
MKISEAERIAIINMLADADVHGYGNFISHLQTAWAARLIRGGMSEKAARLASRGDGYPFLMQQDLLERGEWDETGARYAKKRNRR